MPRTSSTAISSSADPLLKVRVLITNMIAALEAYCNKVLSKTNTKKIEKPTEIEMLTSRAFRLAKSANGATGGKTGPPEGKRGYQNPRPPEANRYFWLPKSLFTILLEHFSVQRIWNLHLLKQCCTSNALLTIWTFAQFGAADAFWGFTYESVDLALSSCPCRSSVLLLVW